MATKNIVIHVDGKEVSTVVRSARKGDGIRRAELMLEAIKIVDNDLRKQVAFYQYPTCVCSVQEPPEMKDMSLDDFIDKVDEADIDEWVSDAYALNPQWRKTMNLLDELGEAEEKKTGIPSNGSLTPTEGKTQDQEISPPLKS